MSWKRCVRERLPDTESQNEGSWEKIEQDIEKSEWRASGDERRR